MYYKESYVLNKSDINMTLYILLIKYVVPINICFLLCIFSCIFCARMFDKFKYLSRSNFLARKKMCNIFH